ncbi:PEP-CTERM sorting domain-containing protein [Rhodopirellula sallentina]|uniref:PEP-CTERM sorting domain-containing protein n=1 Tax=Rhodopirellula sallentina TaxID=1263869 RepID=UPI001360B64B|nr:PEP-CTERM sorting domain-containing protein [Rhodopirellula sallentina]
MLHALRVAAFVLLLAAECQSSVITIVDMNADGNPSSGAELEGTVGGNGTDGTSSFAINTAPSSVQVGSTSARFTVSNVDLNDDNSFNESFVFDLTFSSPNDINFTTSLETMGLGGDGQITLGESFTMTFDIVSDTSATHDVVFDGVSEVDFINLADTDLSITSMSGGTTITLVGGSTPLGGLYVNPTFEYSNTGDLADSGTFEDWSVQFSTITATAVPEPSSLALLGVIAGVVTLRNRRRLAKVN